MGAKLKMSSEPNAPESEQDMAKTSRTDADPRPDTRPAPQQQGDGAPAGQMTGDAAQKPQQGTPVYRDWAAI
jgi:hypothetical protein